MKQEHINDFELSSLRTIGYSEDRSPTYLEASVWLENNRGIYITRDFPQKLHGDFTVDIRIIIRNNHVVRITRVNPSLQECLKLSMAYLSKYNLL